MFSIKYLGHSAFLVTNQNTRIIIDPFFLKPMKDFQKLAIDYVLLSHGHGDHVGSGIEIAKACDARMIAPLELATFCNKKGCKVHAMQIGGGYDFPFGRVKLTIAHHGSGYDLGGESFAYMGNPCGFLITIEGKTLYHAGDTGLFLDMKLIGEKNSIDAALLPIGDNFTMGIDDAVDAIEFLKPKLAIPMHYNTFDFIEANPQEFKDKAEARGFKVTIMQIGETIEI
ncbi:metal-dependent hydrolase [candidate division KSB1 bacterium]|nr:metal-dependent hydrolase [candidate division KSB1 bacterium]